MNRSQSMSRSPSPPPYSPITPEPSIATLARPVENNQQMVDLPPNIPISESTNPDVIALRSALSVLQLQRLRSIKDVQLLNKQKELALANPEAFVKEIIDGRIRPTQKDKISIFNHEPIDDDDDDDEQPSKAIEPKTSSKFEELPRPQNIVRCPPINWSKYHVSGEVLDQIHMHQQKYPPSGDMRQDSTAEPHVIAAPYSPWSDKLIDKPKPKADGSR
jgi:hypothetical protein